MEDNTSVHGNPPSELKLWKDFFDEVNQFCFDQQQRKFEKPEFIDKFRIYSVANVRSAMSSNIYNILNNYISDYIFSTRETSGIGDPDFTCYDNDTLILVFEIKIKYDLEVINKHTFPKVYKTSEKAKTEIQSIYNYMAENQLQYGVLSTYDQHWFMYRPKDKPSQLHITEALPFNSISPPVLKAYAYLALKARNDYFSPHPSTNISHYNLRPNPPCSNTLWTQKKMKSLEMQNLNFTDFKFKGILGTGRCGKTFLCEFNEISIALKSTDLFKTPRILDEMLEEVEIYKKLADIQGRYIPQLVCYGYYGGGMSFVMGTTVVGTTLCKHKKLTTQQRANAIEALNMIHNHNILHKDIRAENILVSDNGVDMYVIDFGMSERTDDKELFDKEMSSLSQLLDKYVEQINVGIRNISIS